MGQRARLDNAFDCNLESMRRLPVQCVMGPYDIDTWEITITEEVRLGGWKARTLRAAARPLGSYLLHSWIFSEARRRQLVPARKYQ